MLYTGIRLLGPILSTGLAFQLPPFLVGFTSPSYSHRGMYFPAKPSTYVTGKFGLRDPTVRLKDSRFLALMPGKDFLYSINTRIYSGIFYYPTGFLSDSSDFSVSNQFGIYFRPNRVAYHSWHYFSPLSAGSSAMLYTGAGLLRLALSTVLASQLPPFLVGFNLAHNLNKIRCLHQILHIVFLEYEGSRRQRLKYRRYKVLLTRRLGLYLLRT